MPIPQHLEVFSDYICPWCYFNTARIEQLQRNYAIDVCWRAFPLHPETPLAGLPLKEIYAARIMDMPQMSARLQQAAGELGLPMKERKKTFNSRLAQELGKWAETRGKGDEFHRAVFHAYFAEGKNIARPGILAEVAGAAGLPEKEAREVVKKRTFREAVDADWELAYQLGISSVPTLVLGNEAVVGAQPYTVLEQLLLEKGVKKR